MQNLQGENCLVVPPFSLITEAFNYLNKRKAIVTVIIPFWPSSDYWPIVARKFYNCIRDFKVFEGKDILLQGRNKNSIFGPSFLGNMLALRMDFSSRGF